jgi:hypothetical protein
MGDDTSLAVLLKRAHLLYDYFKQRFAQVHGFLNSQTPKFTKESITVKFKPYIFTSCYEKLLIHELPFPCTGHQSCH